MKFRAVISDSELLIQSLLAIEKFDSEFYLLLTPDKLILTVLDRVHITLDASKIMDS